MSRVPMRWQGNTRQYNTTTQDKTTLHKTTQDNTTKGKVITSQPQDSPKTRLPLDHHTPKPQEKWTREDKRRYAHKTTRQRQDKIRLHSTAATEHNTSQDCKTSKA